MKILFYHESFEFAKLENYDYEKYEDTGISVTATKIICPICRGTGSHFRNDLDENLLVDGMNEDGDDDGIEAYKNGAFDETCTKCHGKNVINDIDWNTMPKWAQDLIRKWNHDQKVHDAECKAERACGA